MREGAREVRRECGGVACCAVVLVGETIVSEMISVLSADTDSVHSNSPIVTVDAPGVRNRIRP